MYFRVHQNPEPLSSIVEDRSVVLAMLLFVSSAILYRFQRQIGPRLFLQRLFGMSPVFNYFIREEELAALPDEEVCAICYSEFKAESDQHHFSHLVDLSDAMSEFLTKNWQKMMRTPCNHLFHSSCLLAVMNYKPNCPICRTPLPPMDA